MGDDEPKARTERWPQKLAWLVVGTILGAAAALATQVAAFHLHGSQLEPMTEQRLFRAPPGVSRSGGEFRVWSGPGMCSGSSRVDPTASPAAVQCRSSLTGKILDPCWQLAAGRGVYLCTESPWGEATAALRATWVWGLPGAKAPPRERVAAWALELENGERCVHVIDRWEPVFGRPVTYLCGRSRKAPDLRHPDGFLLRMPDRSTRRWTVSFLRLHDIGSEEVGVRVAWF